MRTIWTEVMTVNAPFMIVSSTELARARARQSYLDDGRAPLTDDEAANLVDARGLVMLGADSGLGLPSLSEGDEGREWSVSWRAWRWKETLPAAGRCAYLKWFRGQGTFVAWPAFRSMYALWGPRGGDDAETAWRSGTLGRAELDVLAAIEEAGPVSSRDLWRKLRLRPWFGGQRRNLVASLAQLQRGLYVSVAGGDLDGWSMHHWDLVGRLVPEGLLDRLPAPPAAQESLLMCALENMVIAAPRELAALFAWRPADVALRLHELAASGRVRQDVSVGKAGPPGRFFGRRDLSVFSPG